MRLFPLSGRLRRFPSHPAVLLLALHLIQGSPAQKRDEASVIQQVDSAVKDRFNAIGGYTATEHYAVFRSGDESNPVAEMMVETNYRRESGKSYTILSESGSQIIRRLVLDAILDREKQINEPGAREQAWITSTNYEMKLKPGGPQHIDGRDCQMLSVTPRRKAPNLIVGKILVDARVGSLVQLDGTASKSVSALTGPATVMRQYADIDGFSMATHARAVSNSFLFGTTVVTIDYSDYKIQLRENK
jgi:hypothetical protein